MSNPILEISNEEWEGIILRLQSFTRMLIKDKEWFRGVNVGIYISGKEIDDYVFEAIGRYIKNPEKHDPSKRSLIEYLKKHIIRSLISNDLVSSENQTSIDIFAFGNDTEDTEDSSPYLDAILPHIEVYFHEEMDFNEIMRYIESEAKGDEHVENLFLGIVVFDMKRAEIIKEFGMSSSQYDNAMRRLITIRKKAVKKYEIKNCNHE